MRKLIRKYLLSGCLLLSACTHLPPSIENPPLNDLSYLQAIQNIAYYKNALVRWGGVIIAVESYQYHSFIHVLLYPLDSNGRPDLQQNSLGRFMIKSPKFLDPVIYKANTEVTAFGTLSGLIERTIDQRNLVLPVVLSEMIYLWPAPQTASGYSPYGWGAYGGYNYNHSYGGYGGHTYLKKGTRLPPPLPPPPPSPPPCPVPMFGRVDYTDCPHPPPPPPCDGRIHHHEQGEVNDGCPPPINCAINEEPDGIGGCKPKLKHCESDEIPDGMGGCKLKRIRCESNEVLDGMGMCTPITPVPEPPTHHCDSDEIADGMGGCTPITPAPEPPPTTLEPTPEIHHCDSDEIADGMGGCTAITPAPEPTVTPEPPTPEPEPPIPRSEPTPEPTPEPPTPRTEPTPEPAAEPVPTVEPAAAEVEKKKRQRTEE